MGAWTEIVDYTVPSNTTSVVLNDFGTITKDDFIKVVVTATNATSTLLRINLTANASVNANYTRQVLWGIGSDVIAARDSNARIMDAVESGSSVAIAYIKLSENDRFNAFSNYNFNTGSTVSNQFTYFTSNGATFTSGITSLTFTASTSQIGTGSRIQIYRLDAEKVADITTTANATQVDISSLSIGKDSEYLLVSDVTGGQSSSFTRVYLAVNDSTTTTNYYMQSIVGTGTVLAPGRTNDNQYIFIASPNQISLAHTHIKLSEIGAYTAQSYQLTNLGSSTPIIDNNFISSTSEAITSITKLNIIASATNGIKSGSRFILYKLK